MEFFPDLMVPCTICARRCSKLGLGLEACRAGQHIDHGSKSYLTDQKSLEFSQYALQVYLIRHSIFQIDSNPPAFLG